MTWAAVLIVLAILMAPGQASGQVWVASSLVRVGQNDPLGTTTSINLSAARGETVSTQVIVHTPGAGLTNLNLSASALTGPNGASIPASSITLYREYYITLSAGTTNYGGGSNPPLGSGTYAEPLIPFNDPENPARSLCGAMLQACNATVATGQNQPYWIDIFVPRGATNSPRGTYTGTISVTADQGTASVPVTLTLWNFELPIQPSEPSLWTLWSPNSGNTLTSLDQALMRNKVMGWFDCPPTDPNTSCSTQVSSDIANLGLDRSGLEGFYYNVVNCDGSYANGTPTTSQFSAAASNFPAGLPLDFYLFDEFNNCPNAYQSVKTMATNIHAATPSIQTILTINTPDSNLYNEGDGRTAVDHWVLLDSVGPWPPLPWSGPGDLSSYTSCNTGAGNTPEWMVDYPPINERIQAGFLNWTQGAVAILYYRSDGWTNGNTVASWNNVNTTACGGNSRPGDGIFLYPPGPINSTESAPGIRLKAIRDGIQDYEYARILHFMVPSQDAFVNSTLQPIAGSWIACGTPPNPPNPPCWKRDTTALENARLQLGQKIDQLNP
jgi:hypothetical protein